MKLKINTLIILIFLTATNSSSFAGTMLLGNESQSEIEKIKKQEIIDFFTPNPKQKSIHAPKIELQAWKGICNYVHPLLDQIEPKKYEDFFDFLQHSLNGVQNIKYGNNDYGNATVRKTSEQIL